MSLRTTKTFVILTTLLTFAVGVILLFVSKFVVTKEPWLTLVSMLGSFLIIDVTVDIFHKLFIKPSEDVERKSELRELFGGLVTNSKKYGFDGFDEEMDFNKLFKELQAGDELWWLDTFPLGYDFWEEDLKDAVKRGAIIKMLVLDAESPSTEYRAKELDGTLTTKRFKIGLTGFMEWLNILQIDVKDYSGKLEVVEYSDLLGMPLYLITRDGKTIKAYSSLYLGSATAVAFPHLKWCISECSVLELLHDYLKDKWDRNTKVHKEDTVVD